MGATSEVQRCLAATFFPFAWEAYTRLGVLLKSGLRSTTYKSCNYSVRSFVIRLAPQNQGIGTNRDGAASPCATS